MRLTTKLCLMLALMLLVSPLVFLKGCGDGDTQAPYGSTITINPTAIDVNVIAGVADTPQLYTVTVRGSDGLPLNGVKVTVSGAFAVPFTPTIYTFFDNSGGLRYSPFEGETDEYGNYTFFILIPATRAGGQLLDPVNNTFTASTIGGLTPSGTYCYRVSATNAVGETFASPETCIALGATENAVNVNWGAVTGATGYRIYGRTTGGELFMASVGAVTTWFDDGSITPTPAPAGALPGANTTVLATPVNAVFTAGAGTLNDGTYYYRVSAINAVGETLASAETSLAVSAGAGLNGVNVNWGAVTGATGYRIYGRTTGGELFMAAVGAVTTFLDDGSVAIPAGALPVANDTALADPVNAPFTATTVGLIPSSTNCYRVTALDATANETAASTETCITLTGTQNAVTVNWIVVAGSSGYNIYGRTISVETYLATVASGTTITYLDDGTLAPDGATIPPATNLTVTGQVVNSFTDNIEVRSGAAYGSSEINFNQ